MYRREEGEGEEEREERVSVVGWLGGGGEGIINPFYPPTQPGQMTQTSVQAFCHALTYLRFQVKPLWNDNMIT